MGDASSLGARSRAPVNGWMVSLPQYVIASNPEKERKFSHRTSLSKKRTLVRTGELERADCELKCCQLHGLIQSTDPTLAKTLVSTLSATTIACDPLGPRRYCVLSDEKHALRRRLAHGRLANSHPWRPRHGRIGNRGCRR